MTNKIGLVILNFLTYEDTLNSLISLSEKLVRNIDLKIYIVDNKSDQIKFARLEKDILERDLKFQITYLSVKDNLGFARGMNIGINQAKGEGCDFVICSNNDIEYKKNIDFNKFLEIYNKDNSIAVIGAKILNQNGENQNPYIIEDKSTNNLRNKLKQKFIFTNIIGKLIFFIFGYKNYHKKKSTVKKSFESQCVYSLHGAFFVLTPKYFEYYNELDDNTFLYNEELILAERVKQNNLLMYYCNNIEVFHKDDSSTNEMLGKNSFKKMNFILNENYKSRSYYLKAYKW